MQRQQALMTELENTLWHVFRTLKKEIDQLFRDELTNSEFFFLQHLSQNSPQTVSTFSQKYNVSASHITHLVDRLEKQDLVNRQRSAEDKRIVYITITRQGQHIVKQMLAKKRAYLQQKFERLTTEEIETLVQLFQKVLATNIQFPSDN